MVPDRKGDIERHLSSGKNNSQESEAAHRLRLGGPGMKNRRLVLCILCLFVAVPASFGQAIYAENQIPARGVTIDYTISIKNPISHLYDVEIQIKGIREASVSVSMPAWSP